MASASAHPIQRFTGATTGAVGTSAKVTHVFTIVLTCGAASGTIQLANGADATSPKVTVNCPANDTRTVKFDKALFDKGCFATTTGANTDAAVEFETAS